MKYLFFDFAKDRSDSTLNLTHNVSRTLLIFTPRGMKELSVDRRKSIGKAIQQAYWRQAIMEKYRRLPAKQWYAEQGEGNLTTEQLTVLEASFAQAVPLKSGKGLKIAAYNLAYPEVKKIAESTLPGIIVTNDLGDFDARQAASPRSIGPDDPHMVERTADGMWGENIGFLSYTLNMNYYDFTADKAQTWLKTFINTPVREDRIRMMRQLHFSALASPKVVPLMSEPQVSLLRDTWTMESCPIFSSSALWRITKK